MSLWHALTWIHGGHTDAATCLWVTVMVYIAVIAGLVLLGYLIFASDISDDDVFLIVWGGTVCAGFWPAVLVGALLASIVFGVRKMVQRQVKPKPTPEDLQAKIDRLERELGVTP